jgi:hypothetical protein
MSCNATKPGAKAGDSNVNRLWSHVLARLITAVVVGNPTTALGTDLDTAPAWVTKRPVQPGFAVGIGCAESDDEPLSVVRNRALAAALAQIAAQLQVTVKTSLSLATLEDDDGLQRHFESTARSLSTVALQGIDIVATWCAEGRCWTFARLDISRQQTVQRQATNERQQRLRVLRARLLDPHATAVVALAAGAEATALATDSAEYERLWRQRLARITIEGIAREGAPLVEVVVRDGGQPAVGLPIRLRIDSGSGRIQPLSWTDNGGRARATLTRLQFPASVTACVDPAAGHGTRDLLPPRCVTMVIDQARRRARLQLTTAPAVLPSIRSNLVTLFAAQGVDVVAATDSATLAIDLALTVGPGTSTGGICFTFIDIDLLITDGGHPIHATTATRIRGAGRTCGEAIRAALHTPGTRLREATACGRHIRVHAAPHQVPSGGKPS